MSSSPPSATTCPRCRRQTASPFGNRSCLRCAGERALILDLDETAPEEPEPMGEPGTDLPERIGPYEIVDELGQGGMGRVFAARQPRLDRLVALKVLAAGPSGAALEQRFLREIQTVARLRHPHIVSIYDSGRADGHVYFAMDFVPDGDLAQRIRENPPSPRAAAILMGKVAGALAHAHAEGVLHRDLKPSNILLDGEEPRLADFGLAGQVEPGGDLTLVSAVLGTPHYLAPEAVRAGSAALSVASDLYALGVVLYELLARRTPFAGASAVELPALLQNSEPPPLRLLAPATPRDLETICLKCLERDPPRRYASAADLAEDLRRFVAGEPIIARPPGKIERFTRFARRHRTGLAAATLSVVALTSATLVSTTWAIRASRAEKRVSVEKSAADAVVAFLKDDLLANASPDVQPDPNLKVRTLLDRAAENITKRLTAQPAIEAPIREVIGVTYSSLGEYTVAREHLTRALAASRRQFGADDLRTLAIENELVDCLISQGRSAEAEPSKRRLLSTFRERLGPDDRLTLTTANDFAVLLRQSGKYTEAEVLLRDTVARAERALGADDAVTLNVMNTLGLVLGNLGRPADADRVFTQTVERARRAYGTDNSLTVGCMVSLAGIRGRAGELEAAVRLLEEAVAAGRRSLGPTHPITLSAQHSLAVAMLSMRRLPEAVELLSQVLQARRLSDPDGPQTLSSESTLASTYRELGRLDEAAALFAAVLEKRTKLLTLEHQDTVRAMEGLGSTYAEQGRLAEGVALHQRALEIRRRILSPDHPESLSAMRILGGEFLRLGDLAAAEALLRETLALHERKHPGQWQTANVRCRLGAALMRLQRPTEAEPHLREGYASLQKNLSRLPAIGRKVVPEAAEYLAEFCTVTGRTAEAATWREIVAQENAPKK